MNHNFILELQHLRNFTERPNYNILFFTSSLKQLSFGYLKVLFNFTIEIFYQRIREKRVKKKSLKAQVIRASVK